MLGQLLSLNLGFVLKRLNLKIFSQNLNVNHLTTLGNLKVEDFKYYETHRSTWTF